MHSAPNEALIHTLLSQTAITSNPILASSDFDSEPHPLPSMSGSPLHPIKSDGRRAYQLCIFIEYTNERARIERPRREGFGVELAGSL